MKVLVADKFEQSGLDGLSALGCTVLYEPDLSKDTLPRALAQTGAEVLVVRSTEVQAAALDAGALALIVRAGAGVNTIDVAGASARGIYVSNCPGKNAVAVAELVFGLLLSLDRRIPENVAALQAGRWEKKEFSKARGLAGQTIGLLGFGHIAQEVARRAAAFEMHTLVWSRRFAHDIHAREQAVAQFGVKVVATPRELVSQSAIVSLHLALGKETRGFFNAELIGALQTGAFFINAARGELVDYAALARAVQEKQVRVGLDVFGNEPAAASGAFEDPIASLPGVHGTHHIGASTDQAQEAIATEAVRIVGEFKSTGRVPNVVNLTRKTPASHMLVVRHRDRPGVLAHIFDHLRRANLNVQETENIIFEGAQAAVARINLDGAPESATVDAIRAGHPDVLAVQLVELS